MTSSPTPEFEELIISGYVLGDLSPAEAMLFEEILAKNPQVAQQVIELQQTLEQAYFPAEVAPPPSLKGKLLATANASIGNLNQVEETPNFLTNWGQKITWRKALGAISASLILGLTITNYWVWQTLQRASFNLPDILESNKLVYSRQVYSLQGIDSAGEAEAKLIVNPNQLEAKFTVSNLSPLPEGKVYVLWTLIDRDAPFTRDSKGAILTEVFQVNNQGKVSKKIAVPRVHRNHQQIQKMAITIENESAPQAHTGLILMATEY